MAVAAVNPVRVGDVLKSNRSGYFKVIKIGVNLSQIHIKFLNTGYIRVVKNAHAKKGRVTDPFARLAKGIGYFGREISEKKRNDKCLAAWHDMLKMHVDGKARVSFEWLNYSNFESWFCKNVTDELCCIVKDSSSTIYCKYTVRAVTISERNIEITKPRMKRFSLKNINTNETVEGINMAGVSKKLGLYSGAVQHLVNNEASNINGWTVCK